MASSSKLPWLSNVEILSSGEPVLSNVQPGRSTPKDGQAIGIPIGQRAQEQGISDTENRSVGSDPDRKGQDCGNGESGRSCQYASAITQILEHRQ
jgi:hypothetical protein